MGPAAGQTAGCIPAALLASVCVCEGGKCILVPVCMYLE